MKPRSVNSTPPNNNSSLPPAAKIAAHHPPTSSAVISPCETSDEDLMRQTQDGDGQAFAILYQRHGPAVSRYLRRMLGNAEDTEGLAQEVFLRAFRFAPTYRYPGRFTTWLFTVARNLAINNTRSRHRSPMRNVGDWGLAGVAPACPDHAAARGPDDVDNQEEIALVLAAMEGLPPAQKEVIVLRLFQDLTYSQIAQLMGASAVTLRSRMFHGLKRLATLVSEQKSTDAGPPPLECGADQAQALEQFA
jgi:RNA polymerase sigma-70 factor, ECF subfamily